MKRWLMSVAVFFIIFPLTAQTIEGSFSQKSSNLIAGSYVIRNAEKNTTYSVEIWAAPTTTKEFIKLDNVNGTLGPGVTGDRYQDVMFNPEILPSDWGNEIIFRFIMVPDKKIKSEDFVMMVDRPDSVPAWFGENLSNSRYYTFGITAMGTQPAASGKFTASFMITNISNNPITLSWGPEASQIRYINQNGGQSMSQSGQLYIGNRLLRSNYVEIPAGTTVEGFIRYPMGVNSVRAIEFGHIALSFNSQPVTTIRFQPVQF